MHWAAGDFETAVTRYQSQLESFVLRKQRSAFKFAGAFAPKSKLSMLLRNGIMNLLRVPWLADFAVGRDLGDDPRLPDY